MLPASAADMERCIQLREKIVSVEKATEVAKAHLEELKPRLDSLSKRIDDLSLKEADDYVTNGRVNPDTERELTQLRAEYKALTHDDNRLIATNKRIIETYQEQMRAEGCPAPNTPAPKKAPPPSRYRPPDTSSSSEHVMVFRFRSDQMTLKAPSDFRTITVEGTMTGILLPTISGQTRFDCPTRTGSGPDHYLYHCTMSVKVYESASPGRNVLAATSQGQGSAGLYLAKNHKSKLVIDIDKEIITDLMVEPHKTTTVWHPKGMRLDEVAR